MQEGCGMGSGRPPTAVPHAHAASTACRRFLCCCRWQPTPPFPLGALASPARAPLGVGLAAQQPVGGGRVDKRGGWINAKHCLKGRRRQEHVQRSAQAQRRGDRAERGVQQQLPCSSRSGRPARCCLQARIPRALHLVPTATPRLTHLTHHIHKQLCVVGGVEARVELRLREPAKGGLILVVATWQAGVFGGGADCGDTTRSREMCAAPAGCRCVAAAWQAAQHTAGD